MRAASRRRAPLFLFVVSFRFAGVELVAWHRGQNKLSKMYDMWDYTTPLTTDPTETTWTEAMRLSLLSVVSRAVSRGLAAHSHSVTQQTPARHTAAAFRPHSQRGAPRVRRVRSSRRASHIEEDRAATTVSTHAAPTPPIALSRARPPSDGRSRG